MFSNYWFAAFVVILLPVYWLVAWSFVRKLVLLVSSGVFYWYYAGPAGVAPIIVLAVSTYLAALSGSRSAMIAAIALNVGALVFFKYTLFLTSQLVFAFDSHWGASIADFQHQTLAAITAPLAISFFVFEYVHYLVDVMKGSGALRSPLQFGLFAAFFPTVVAGPIKRYEQFVPSMERGTARTELEDITVGLMRFVIGLTKKLLLADFLTGYIAATQPRFAGLSLAERWLVFVAIALRILFDFSGYSDMAIGLGRMMGIRIPENFNWPYLSMSVQDFWRRWHISLSTWIRDYIYIPLGGSRVGLGRKVLNGLFAFALCGLWHGAAWNFALWGVYHGIGLTISANYRQVLGRPGETLSAILGRAWPIKWAVTQFFVMVGWLYFFYPVPEATRMLALLFGATLT